MDKTFDEVAVKYHWHFGPRSVIFFSWRPAKEAWGPEVIISRIHFHIGRFQIKI